jgi:RNase H-fold protein (predicted Holliday junction resolvase)
MAVVSIGTQTLHQEMILSYKLLWNQITNTEQLRKVKTIIIKLPHNGQYKTVNKSQV